MKRIAGPLLVALAVLLSLTGAAHAFPGRNGAIVYGWRSASGEELDEMSYAAGIWQIVPTPPEREQELFGCTDRPASPQENRCAGIHDRDPAVSPDGRRVAFDEGKALAVVGADGSHLRQLPVRGDGDGAPAFSPTGDQLAFTVAEGGHHSVWITDVLGRHARRLVRVGAAPAWSTTGWIAFCRSGGIYRIRPDGSHLQLLTRHGATPAWSPHGTQLAFTYAAPRHHYRLFTLDVASRRTSALKPQGGVTASDLAWAPDGRELALLDDQSLSTFDLRTRRWRSLAWANPVGGGYDGAIDGIDWQPLR